MWWFAFRALASERAAWDALYDAMLAESLDGDLTLSEARYNALVQGLPAEHPLHGESVYLLAMTRWTAGHVDDARETAMSGIRAGSCRSRCTDLVARIDLDRAAIRTVPTLWDFSGEHGVFHPWEHADQGAIRTLAGTGPSDGDLEWSTEVSVRESDELVFAFDHPSPAPERIQLTVRSTDFEAWLRLWAVDDTGREYVLGSSVRIPTDESVELGVRLADARPLDGRPEPLDPARLSRVWIRDVTHLSGTGTGPNTLVIDDLLVE